MPRQQRQITLHINPDDTIDSVVIYADVTLTQRAIQATTQKRYHAQFDDMTTAQKAAATTWAARAKAIMRTQEPETP